MIISPSFILGGCSRSNPAKPIDGGNNEKISTNEKKTETSDKNSDKRNSETDVKSGEADLKEIEFSKAIAKLTKKSSDSFELSIKITRAEEIIFDKDSKEIFVKVNVVKDGEDDNFNYKLDLDKEEKDYKEIPLEDNKIPASAQFIIKEDSNLISEKEKALLLEGDNPLISIKVYNPSGELMNVANVYLD